MTLVQKIRGRFDDDDDGLPPKWPQPCQSARAVRFFDVTAPDGTRYGLTTTEPVTLERAQGWYTVRRPGHVVTIKGER